MTAPTLPVSAATRPPGRERSVRALARAVTPLGRTVLAGGVVTGVVALLADWTEIAVLALACVIAVLVGIIFLLVGRTDLTVGLHLVTPRVVVGDTARSDVAATNPTTRRMAPTRLETRVGRTSAPVRVPTLAPGATHDETLMIPTERRSVLPVGPVRSVQGDPLGLVRREITWTGTEDLYVHPRTVPLRSLTTGWRRDLEGESTNDRSPSDVAFHTLREYVVGDDRRHIHWRTTARQPDGKLMVREFVDTRRAHVGVVVSARASDYTSSDEFELAMSAVGSFGVRALADEQDLTAIIGGRRLPSFHAPVFLDAVAGIVIGEDDSDIAVVAGRAGDLLAGVSVAAVITGGAADTGRARVAVDLLGASVTSIVIRAELGAESSVRATSSAPIVTIGRLEDLPRVLLAVTE